MKANYGIDAPIVVRNLILSFLLTLVLFALSFLINNRFWFWYAFLSTIFAALSFLISLGWMMYSSLYMKPKIARQLIDSLELTGDEKLLDVGCGRGLLLIEAARRLPRGKACGVDLWTQDQSGNSLQATLNNTQLEHLDKRIELQTADIRSLPYPDQSFDAVISSLVIHNIPTRKGREQALNEIFRVLKPSGRFAIFDLHYGGDYIDYLDGKVHLTLTKKLHTYCPWAYLIMGSKRNFS